MEPASHILEWAHNSGHLYLRLKQLADKNRYKTNMGRFSDANNLVWLTVREMEHMKEIQPNEYGPEDYAKAVILMLEWGS